MRTRTRLTTPPGQEPEPEGAASGPDEPFSGAFRRPREPGVAGPWLRVVRVLLALVVVALIAAVAVWVVGATEDRDPSLQQRTEQTSPQTDA